VTGRIFQALPTQTDTTVAFIYKMGTPCLPKFEGCNIVIVALKVVAWGYRLKNKARLFRSKPFV
jgi:hypothetical protein